MNSTSASTKWTGWYRPDQRSPWRAVVSAADEATAFNRLLDMVRGGDKAILPAGVDPNTTPPQPRRRRF